VLPAELLAWVESTTRGRLVAAERRGGGRREAWLVTVGRSDDAVAELLLQYDRGEAALDGNPWTVHREAAVHRALQGTDIPVTPLVAVHETYQAMLTVQPDAESWFGHADPAEKARVASDFMACLAALHRLDPATLDLPGFPPATSSVMDLVDRELDELETVLANRGGDPDPALAFSLDWLRRNIPLYDGPAVLLQGDTGPGNFLFADGRVVALVGWELAHLGDPMDDIAWLTLRCIQHPIPDLPARLREYEERSGHEVDEHRVRYYQVMAEVKLQVMAHAPSDGPSGSDVDLASALVYRMLHRRLWIEALASAVGLALTDVERPPPRDRDYYDEVTDALVAQVREVAPRVDDPVARQRVKGVARVLEHLVAIRSDGAFYDRCELDDVEVLLGERPATVQEGRDAMTAAVRERRIDDLEYLDYLRRRVARENELLRPASGTLADRTWPY
jgi:hypothetical protein